MQRANRRKFLSFSLGAGGLLAAGSAAWLSSRAWRTDGDSDSDGASTSLPSPDSSLQGATRTSWALGADVSITALHANQSIAAAAVDDAFDELELVEQLMSIYRPESQLSRLNRNGVLADPHPLFALVLRHAKSLSAKTNGAFDVTVQPLWAVYANAHRAGRLPDADAIAAARRRVDWRRVEVSPRRIRFRGRGTAVTLNGIAQGLAADRAAAALRSRGVQHALVNTGEIGAIGGKDDKNPWKVGIQHPRRADAYMSLASLTDRCLATSGDYETSFSEDHSYNHLFDPRTGRSPDGLASVSVAACSAMQADALSTAVFVLGAEQGLRLVRSTRGADALLMLKDGRVFRTEEFPVES